MSPGLTLRSVVLSRPLIVRKKPFRVHFGPELVCVCVYHQDIFTSSGMLLETVVLPLAVSYLSQKQT